MAIFRYLTREYNVADHWYPKDSKAMAQVDEFLEWQHLNLRAHGSMLFLHKVKLNLNLTNFNPAETSFYIRPSSQ